MTSDESTRYAILTSGSCGNCYAFHSAGVTILIDDGLTLTGLSRRLGEAGLPLEGISDVFVTHMHPDHSKGLGVLSRRHPVKIHASSECIRGEEAVFKRLAIRDEDLEAFAFHEEVTAGPFRLTAFPTSHDSKGSAGYRIEAPDSVFFLMTDTGDYGLEAIAAATDADVLFLESNYDEDMLVNGRYPWPLKRRVMGECGHLSNKQAYSFLQTASCPGADVFLVHLSENNNRLDLVEDLYKDHHLELGQLTVCERGRSYGAYSIGS